MSKGTQPVRAGAGLEPRTAHSQRPSCCTSEATGHILSFLSLLQLQYCTLSSPLSSFKEIPVFPQTIPCPVTPTPTLHGACSEAAAGGAIDQHTGMGLSWEPLLEEITISLPAPSLLFNLFPLKNAFSKY